MRNEYTPYPTVTGLFKRKYAVRSTWGLVPEASSVLVATIAQSATNQLMRENWSGIPLQSPEDCVAI